MVKEKAILQKLFNTLSYIHRDEYSVLLKAPQQVNQMGAGEREKKNNNNNKKKAGVCGVGSDVYALRLT